LRKWATPDAAEVSNLGPACTTIPTDDEGNPSSRLTTDIPETSATVYFIGAALTGCLAIDLANEEEKRLNMKISRKFSHENEVRGVGRKNYGTIFSKYPQTFLHLVILSD
jgi:hypothetical protein